jgi:hypothetical protein
MTEEIATPVENDVPQVEAPEERLVPQSHVNDLIGVEKHKGYQKGYQAALEEVKQNQPQAPIPEKTNTQSANIGNMTSQQVEIIAQEQMTKLLEQQSQEQQNKVAQDNAEKIMKDLVSQEAGARERYDDYDKVIKDLPMADIAHLLPMIHSTGKKAVDVLYDLSKHSMKIGQINALYQTSPTLAHRQMQELADSIENNQAAQNQTQASAPLGQYKSSNVGTGGNTDPSLKELKQKYIC